jgi:SOS-response transcriptional repressor LexA
MTTRPRITKKQQEVLNFMRAFFEEQDQLPPCHVIRDHFGWASDNAAYCFQIALEDRGLIEKNAVGKYRFARVREEAC